MAVILPSVYKDGTTSVAANGTVVTGQGTLFTKSVLPGDFYGAHKGLNIMIATVDSDTSLTLADPYTGPTQTAAPYKIMLQSDMARVQETTRQMLEKLESGNVDALAGLAGGADKFPYFNGVGTMAQGDVTPFARSNVLSKSDRASLLASGTGIGVSAAVEKFGPVVADFNTVTQAGWSCGYPAVTANCPLPGNAWLWAVLTLFWADGVTCTQHARRIAGGNHSLFRSGTVGGSFGPWGTQAGDLLGAVSQLGGIPTGAVVERGANALGNYTRIADGTQFTWGTLVVNDTVAPGIGAQAVVSQPAVFVTQPFTFGRICFFTGVNATGSEIYGCPFSLFGSDKLLFLQTGHLPAAVHPLFSIGSWSAASFVVQYHSMGRWF